MGRLRGEEVEEEKEKKFCGRGGDGILRCGIRNC